MSIGYNPYYDNKEKTLEPYLIHDFEGDFYGEELRLLIAAHVRTDQIKFDSLDGLIDAIHWDIISSSKLLDEDPQYNQLKNHEHFESSGASL